MKGYERVRKKSNSPNRADFFAKDLRSVGGPCRVLYMNEATTIITDGGRAAAGFASGDGDCLVRAIAIFTGRDYTEVHNAAVEHNARWGRQGLGPGVVRGASFLSAQGFKAIDITPADRNDPHFTVGEVAENFGDCIARSVNPDTGAFHATAILDGKAHDTTSAPLGRLALTLFTFR